MGFLDFLLTDKQKKEKIATQVGLECGLFIECPVCRDVTEAKNKDALQEKAEKLAQTLISTNDPKVSLFHHDAQELQTTIDRVAQKLPYHCMCENI